MKLGITSLIYHKRSFLDCVKDVAEIGYNYIEPNFVTGYYGHYNALELEKSPKQLAAIVQALCDSHLACSGVDCHGLCQGNMEKVEYTIRYVSAGIHVAKALCCPILITSYPCGEASWSKIVDATIQLANEAKALDILYAVEPERRYPVSNSKNLRQLINDVGDNLVKVNFDPTHFIDEGEDPIKALHNFIPELVHVHLKDYIDGKPAPFLGQKGSPAYRLLKELQRLDFQGVVSVETLADVCDEPERLARDIYAAIQRTLAE
ncbi:MAG: sugar phosphate isomerase/epimerase [Victivallales bacterium]|nr:sugar phosphate isomerase/epimerase [Victivallales bacterium]